MKPKQEHAASKMQGTEVEFAEITAGIQMTMLLKMASSFNLAVMDFSEEVLHETHMHDVDVTVRIKTDARGIGEIHFITTEFQPSVWKLGGMYALRTSQDRELAGLQPFQMLTCLNMALLKLRSRTSHDVH